MRNAPPEVKAVEYKLVIYPLYDLKVKSRNLKKEITLDEGYDQSQAELRALRWLSHCPFDIVMLVPA